MRLLEFEGLSRKECLVETKGKVLAYKCINYLPYLNLKLDGFHMLEVTKVVLYLTILSVKKKEEKGQVVVGHTINHGSQRLRQEG